MFKRESGENPLQPPLLYTETNSISTGFIWEGRRRTTRESGDLPFTFNRNLSEGEKMHRDYVIFIIILF